MDSKNPLSDPPRWATESEQAILDKMDEEALFAMHFVNQLGDLGTAYAVLAKLETMLDRLAECGIDSCDETLRAAGEFAYRHHIAEMTEMDLDDALRKCRFRIARRAA